VCAGGVVADRAADRAAVSGRRVGRELQVVWLERAVQVREDGPRLHRRVAIVGRQLA